MDLVVSLWEMVSQLEGAFSRQQTFRWAFLVIVGFCTRQDSMGGVTAFIRSVGIRSQYYQRLTDFFHSKAIDLKKLTCLWVGIVFLKFQKFLLTVKGRHILIVDGIVAPKQGKKMPGVQCLHQSSESNTKAEFVMGHFFQCVGILAECPGMTPFCVMLFGRIHLGTKETNRDKRTLFNKALSMLGYLPRDMACYLLGDSYYSVRKMAAGLKERGSDLITKCKITAVGYLPTEKKKGKKRRGRPKKYGKKLKLMDLFANTSKFTSLPSPVYKEKNVLLKVMTIDLLSKSFRGMLIRFVLVDHPSRGKIILLSTDLSLTASEIISLYGLRFKIELAFKMAKYITGTFLYRFWMRMMKKTGHRERTKHIHMESIKYREQYLGKINAYHLFVQFAIIAQGCMQYLSLTSPRLVWSFFGSWIRTIRPDVLPSEMVVGHSLRNCLIYFLDGCCLPANMTKFLREKVDIQAFGNYKRTA